MRSGSSLQPISDAEIERLRQEDLANPRPAVTSARYSKSTDAFVLEFANRMLFRVPRELISELVDIAPGASLLSRITILGDGFAIAWDDIDVAYKIETLLEGAIGERAWMSELGVHGGRRKTVRKADAARENGRKGGRPRKACSAQAFNDVVVSSVTGCFFENEKRWY